MKWHLLVAALSLTAATAAEAKCSVAALNGNWILFQSSGSTGPAVTMAGGVVTAGGTTFTVTSFGSSCKGAGKITSGGNDIPMIVTSEGVKSTSSAKPNMLTFTFFSGPIATSFQLLRR